MRLKDKVGIITGAAQGIGRATAELFAREGAKVVNVDVDEALAQKTAEQISAEAGASAALGVKADVTNYDSCDAAVKLAIEKFGKLDILVNNAGITKDNLLMRMSETEWDLVLDVNLKGAFHFTKACVRPMMRAHSGRIVNVASVVGLEGNIGQANYAASKGGLIAFTKSCAKEFCSRNILVNAIAPGFIRTRLTDAVSDEAKKRMMDRILLGRIGEPIDIARVALFLASEDASYITGQVISVNGGVYL
ncbi:MAG: 3-oxoacyl-[acyl-carrier-protein] reductase [Elusimicrobia bacterium]|nr:3-oxoacyl-[acyl-carrier-protein] reductase [Elusimicrobiota bacterium]